MTRAAIITSGAVQQHLSGTMALWTRPVLLIILALLGGIGMVAPARAAERTPLLMEGKSTLYQRVLTRPGASLHAEPAETAPMFGADLPPLSVFFVYDRRSAGGAEWLAIGRTSRGRPDGWIRADTAIDWRQTLTVTFTPPINRDRALFFHDRRDLVATVKSADPSGAVKEYYADIDTGTLPANGSIVSIEPDKPVDMLRNFYLLPILDHGEVNFKRGFSTQILQVAAESLPQETASEAVASLAEGPGKAGTAPSQSDYKVGVVFVIDTTTSMDPYIDRTREAVRRIYRSLADSPFGDNMAFGLVGFRDNITVRPGLEYVTRIFSQLRGTSEETAFFRQVSQARSATVSSQGFDEDAYAGILSAIREIDWNGYDGRFVVLITDAGARRASDPLGSTGHDAPDLNILAREKGIATLALHLLTPQGRKANDIEPALAQYVTLTHFPGAGSLYLGIDVQDEAAFGQRINRLAEQIARQVADIAKVKAASERPPSAVKPSASKTDAADFEQKVDQVGRAMQLAYLGRIAGTEAPRLFEAWVADRDLANPAHKTLQVRALITKNQLSDLQDTLRKILDAGEKSRLTPGDFFEQLRTAAATLSRAPETVNESTVRRVADLGLQAEYLEDLPYKSKLMELTEDDWLSWGFGQQREFLDELESKLETYQEFHDQTDLWVALDGGRIKGDAVYQIPLDALP